MLIAMTYKGELFVAVIGGLTLGHAFFNLHAPVPASADPCCRGADLNNEGSIGQPLVASYQAPMPAAIISPHGSDVAGRAVYRLHVSGMVCAQCEEKVSSTLAMVPGVLSVRADSTSGEVQAICVPRLQAQALIDALQHVGRDALLIS